MVFINSILMLGHWLCLFCKKLYQFFQGHRPGQRRVTRPTDTVPSLDALDFGAWVYSCWTQTSWLSLCYYIPMLKASFCMKMGKKCLWNETLVPRDCALHSEIPSPSRADFQRNLPFLWAGRRELGRPMSGCLGESRPSPPVRIGDPPPTGGMRTLECEMNAWGGFISW